MIVTEYSFVMAVIWSSIFIILLSLCRKSNYFICVVGVPAILLLFIGFILRIILSVEFPFSMEVGAYGIVANINAILQNDIIAGVEIPVYKMLVLVWIVVSLILMIYKTAQYVKLTKGIGKLNDRTSVLIQTYKDIVEKEIGKIKAEVICSPVIKIPMCVGLVKKMILLPDKPYKEDEIYYILKHEYMHLKNKDIHVKVLIEMFVVLFWWNPFVYLLRYNLAHVLEIRCDLAVIGMEKAARKMAYLNTIIETIRDDRQKKSFNFVAAEFVDFTSKRKIKQRFQIVVGYGANKRMQRICSRIFGLLFFITFFLSYIFVIQPAYHPPLSEISNVDYEEATPDKWHIIEVKKGEYALKDSDNKMIEISEEMKELMVENGFEVKEE